MVLRIFKMIVTRSFLSALECKKFVFGRGSAPEPHWWSLQRSPIPSSLRGTNSKREERGRKLRERGRGEEMKVRHPLPSKIP